MLMKQGFTGDYCPIRPMQSKETLVLGEKRVRKE
jgi:hypothetical protein